ncbi:hypothetical protein BTUL_0131g00100 [Botrytis tulipae]|uniref:Uncharacterized protein n=1 Tax=Botrytis tulipae TaxID=87230 RepID=A0A4Z1EMN3_9HELO|nr:hypothetical protein BTUL_0131g00100 [Botrytis tulipae]
MREQEKGGQGGRLSFVCFFLPDLDEIPTLEMIENSRYLLEIVSTVFVYDTYLSGLIFCDLDVTRKELGLELLEE